MLRRKLDTALTVVVGAVLGVIALLDGGAAAVGRVARWLWWVARGRPAAPPPAPTEVVVHAGTPMPIARVPIRNERRDMKRAAQQFVAQQTGKQLSPKGTRKAIKKLLREQRAADRAFGMAGQGEDEA